MGWSEISDCRANVKADSIKSMPQKQKRGFYGKDCNDNGKDRAGLKNRR
jgi:hypothetical protein